MGRVRRSLNEMVNEMSNMGFDTTQLEKKAVKRSRSRLSERIEDDEEAQKAMKRKLSHSKKPQKDTANLSEPLKKKARAASQLSQRFMKMTGQRGEADSFATASLDKFLNSGKRKNGTHYAR